MTSIWFPNNKYHPNAKNYLYCLLLGGTWRDDMYYIYMLWMRLRCAGSNQAQLHGHVFFVWTAVIWWGFLWFLVGKFTGPPAVFLELPSGKGHWSLVTLITVSTFWSKKDRVTSDQVCSKSHTCHTKMVRPLCGRLWPYSCPKHDFWRKSRRKASFLSFVASFLKEVSQKSFVFEFRSFIFEGSLAEKLRCRASKHHFWRKSRRKASF